MKTTCRYAIAAALLAVALLCPFEARSAEPTEPNQSTEGKRSETTQGWSITAKDLPAKRGELGGQAQATFASIGNSARFAAGRVALFVCRVAGPAKSSPSRTEIRRVYELYGRSFSSRSIDGLPEVSDGLPDDVATESSEGGTDADTVPDLPDEFTDPAFDRYVDIIFVAEAVDASLLTDAGLQRAEGERVLTRPHKAISAERILLFAAKVGADKGDKQVLARLKTAASMLKNEKLAATVQSGEKLARGSRTIRPQVMIAMDDFSGGLFLLMKAYVNAIRRARLFEDGALLGKLVENI